MWAVAIAGAGSKSGLYGPFDTQAAASQWAAQALLTSVWVRMRVLVPPPQTFTLDESMLDGPDTLL
jgi:hypothetical protein